MLVKENIIIRTVEEEDLSQLYKWNSQSSRGTYQEFHFSSLVKMKKEFQETGFNSDTFKMLMVEIKSHGTIGLIYINLVREGLCRLGIVIAKEEYRNGGYGSKITNIIVKYLFDNYPIVRIEADTDSENIGAQKVLEKAGFEKEGVLRSYRYHHGEWRDSAIYSILKD